MTTQLDRMEEMLTKLVRAHPSEQDNLIHRADAARMVVDLVAHIAAGRQIEAIKTYRTLTERTLKESKDAIEAVSNRLAAAYEAGRRTA
jgi:ribosomal protein L7/L12